MYVNPFWFGVLVTVIAEIVGLIALATFSSRGKKK